MMSKLHRVMTIIMLITVLMVTGCQVAPKEEQGPAPTAVEVTPVKVGEVHTTTVLSGQVRARVEVPVLAKQPLQVVGVKAKVGDKVEAGQVLLQLDKR
jgi:multidrug efflux pump subunit AcrA (membrane-fusion protein)